MTRPSQNVDRKLLDAGRALIPTMGISGLKVRAVAKKAGANLGMFAYHFGSKETYIEALMKDVYAEFIQGFTLEAAQGANSLERLRSALIGGAHFIRDNRTLVAALFEEIITGNRRIADFACKNMTRHVTIIMGLIRECQKDGYLAKTSLFTIVPILIGAAALPSIVVRVLEKNYQGSFLGAFAPLLRTAALSDKEIRTRIDCALNGLRGGQL